jgi:hypothetical protein
MNSLVAAVGKPPWFLPMTQMAALCQDAATHAKAGLKTPQSKLWRAMRKPWGLAERLGVRQSSGAFESGGGPPQSPAGRDWREIPVSSNLAQRLECGAFTAALGTPELGPSSLRSSEGEFAETSHSGPSLACGEDDQTNVRCYGGVAFQRSRFNKYSASASRATALPLKGFNAAKALPVRSAAIFRDFSSPTMLG